MATTTTDVGVSIRGNRILRHSETSAGNTALTVTVAGGKGRRFLMATVQYSAAPTQTGATTVLDSGAGSAFDCTLNTGAANAQSTTHIPSGEIPLGNDDAIKVTAPAAGGVITGSIAVYTEECGPGRK